MKRSTLGTGGGGGRDRRREARHEAAEPALHLGWWAGTVFRSEPAALRDVSRGGALAVAARRPPGDGPVWVCLTGRPFDDWAEAAVVAAADRPDGSVALHLRFADGACPFELFHRAVYGLSVGV